MATAYVTFGQAGHYSGPGGHQPVFTGQTRTVTVTTSGTAADTAISARPGEIAKVYCETALIASAVGAATATGTRNGTYIAPATAEWIGCVAGQPISLIDA